MAPGCKQEGPREVTIYTSVDEPYARPVFDEFTRKTGVTVRPVYRTEADPNLGLAPRLLAERRHPQADVFWNSEVMQTLLLQKEGAITPYRSASIKGIPPRFRDPEYYWSGFAARFRVLVYRPGGKAAPPAPTSLLELGEPRYRGQVAMANPLFGSTLTEAAALFQLLGADRARAYYTQRKANGTVIVAQNGDAVDRTAQGDTRVGQADTDDAFAREEGKNKLQVIFPDQQGVGALLIPNTIALVKGAPHLDRGRQFIDFVLRPETELLLAHLPTRQLPLHESVQDQLPAPVRPLAKVQRMPVDYPRLIESYTELDVFLRQTFPSAASSPAKPAVK